jgi:hypothetical protein
MKHKKNLIKSAKARVTGTIPYCHGKVPHSRKCILPGHVDPLNFVGVMSLWTYNFPKYTSEAACQHNSKGVLFF